MGKVAMDLAREEGDPEGVVVGMAVVDSAKVEVGLEMAAVDLEMVVEDSERVEADQVVVGLVRVEVD